MRHAAPALAAIWLLAGCEAGEAPAPAESAAAPAAAAAPAPPKVADFPALASKDCGEVVEFYLEALGGRAWARAALVWNDPAIDAGRLERLFGGYKELQLAWTDPFVEGAAGSAYCTVSGTLTDARDPARPAIEGTLLLKRVNDVPGATADQLRWTLRSSTFVEPLERSDGGEP
ncbi:MAG TPA: hypothetical protein VFS49_10455 [Croceibacterium sp.]|nr:hypothetical protein [Croceibacterium sp.]